MGPYMMILRLCQYQLLLSGEMFLPSQVKRAGITPFVSNAGLVMVRVMDFCCGSGVGACGAFGSTYQLRIARKIIPVIIKIKPRISKL